jgi:uncharacterized protein with NAD-binding domain and iron-sulfur cluster/Rieske Fe-S protein
MMHRAGVSESALQVAPGSLMVFPDGSTYPMKPFLIRLPSPMFLLVYFLKSPIRGIVDLLSLVRAGLAILCFDGSRDFKGLDRFTFRSWLWRRGVSDRMYQSFFEPFVRSFAFDSAARVSAAAAMSAFHLYLVRHQEDFIARWLTDDPDRLIIQPFVDHIRTHGGRVVTGVRVEGLVLDSSGRVISVQTSKPVDDDPSREPPGIDALARIDPKHIPAHDFLLVPTEHGGHVRIGQRNGQVVAFGTPGHDGRGAVPGQQSADSAESATQLSVHYTSNSVVVRSGHTKEVQTEIARVKLSALPQQGFTLIQGKDRPIFVGRSNAGVLQALSPICTHAGTEVQWNTANQLFECRSHGSQFRADGSVLTGPAQSPLLSYSVRTEADEVVVLAKGAELHGTHFLLAVDVEACKNLLKDQLQDYKTFRAIDFLGTVPVIVVRLWFPGRGLLGDKTSGIFVDYPLLDNFFVLSNLQNSFRTRDETVIEVQAYLVKDEIQLPDAAVIEAVLGDLRRAFPQLNLHPRKFHIQRHVALFSHHEAGSDEHRPDTRTPVPNLYLAGDWVTRSPDVWNMERAIVTGKQAAAAIIENAGGIGPSVLKARLGGCVFRAFVTIIRAGGAILRWISRLIRGDDPATPSVTQTGRRWSSTISFGVVKFRGQPNEQLVTGTFRRVNGRMRVALTGGPFQVTGDFQIDLESFDSGILLRDYNVRSALFDTPINPIAGLRLTQCCPLADASHTLVFDHEYELQCAGDLTLNKVSRKLAFRATGSLSPDGLFSIYSEDEIILKASDFNLDLGALRARCGALVEDDIHLSFRLAVPYVLVK